MIEKWLAREVALNDKSLIGFWPLVTNRLDHSGNAAHSHMVGGDIIYPRQLAGRRCVVSEQVNAGVTPTASHLIVPNSDADPLFAFTKFTAWSFSCWVYLDSYNNLGTEESAMISKIQVSGGPTRGWLYGFDTVGRVHIEFRFGGAGEFTVKSVDSLPLKKWCHVVINYDGGNNVAGFQVFIDAIQSQMDVISGSAFGGDIDESSQPLRILGAPGQFNTPSTIDGGMNFVRLYKRVLSQQHIGVLHNREKNAWTRFDSVKATPPPPSANIDLFIHGYDDDNDNTTLFVEGGFFDEIPLFIHGQSDDNDNIPLFIRSELFDDIPLFIHGQDEDNNNIPLFINGLGVESGDITLFTKGHDAANRNMNLFLQTDPIPTGVHSTTLFTFGTNESGFFKAADLFVFSDSSGNIQERTMPLFIGSPLSDASTRNMNLFLPGVNQSASASVQLFLQNDGSGNTQTADLFIQGDGVTDGATPYERNMNLFICRNPANATTLFLKVIEDSVNNNVPLFLDASVPQSANTPLAMAEVVGHSVTDNTTAPKLYTHGF